MKSLRSQNSTQGGFILPLVLIASLVIGASLMATTMRAWLGFTGAARQSQARSAREVAEAGLAQLVESLNREYAHLLVIDHDVINHKNHSEDPDEDYRDWHNPTLFSSLCSNNNTGMPTISGAIGSKGRFSLETYEFDGTPFYGGKAKIRMRGELLRSDNSVAAAAIVMQTVEIKPKSCTTAYGEATDTSGFPGLLGQTVTLGGNDVLGGISGNVLCLQCTTEADAGQNPTSIVSKLFLGPIDLPSVPTPPDTEDFSVLEENPFSFDHDQVKCNQDPPSPACASLNADGNIEIIGGSTDSTKLLNGQCKVDGKGITHCIVDKLLLRNNELIVNTSASPVRIYFRGEGDVFNISGNGGLRHIPADAPSHKLGLFGNSFDANNHVVDQEVTLRGAADTNNLWMYFPDGNLGIAGGAQDNSDCEELDDGSMGECTGGDIYGAVWSKTWGQTNGASSGTGVQIVVPDDMGQQLYNNYGTAYAIGLRDYVALGTSKWSSFIIETPSASNP